MVHFHSLRDFDTSENVEEFLEKVRQNSAAKSSQAKGGTNLFLQDFPSEGKLDMKYIFNIFTVTLRLRSLAISKI